MYVIATVFCSNFHFSVSLHVPFSQFLFERDSYSNEYLLAKFGFDTAENEPCNVCPLSAYRSPRCDQIDFLLVSGDDTFVILENLREYLDRIWTLHGAKERPSRPLYIGNFFQKAKLRFSDFRLERIFF